MAMTAIKFSLKWSRAKLSRELLHAVPHPARLDMACHNQSEQRFKWQLYVP